ncbi:fasciclin domain-containing protein [Nocardioides sp. CER19]|uniref:fasciclin domain-containing protein n=1 Tax=Nocardioides sp. CER19 TaxID=3038538 RepID=UPI00244AE150|nr:fasciclin domain-containing protein [Nocardioides sp. CER19]MDH2414970.1 fasciclin domain-containing protein [Nocardioides sp. CER19]
MNQLHRVTHGARLGLVGMITATLAATAMTIAPAQAADRSHHMVGHRSLAAVLAADKGFDHNWNDFDVLDKAVTTVLKAKPHSPVKVLTQGRTRLTAFLPTDRAFRRLVRDLTGRAPRTERGTFRAVTRAADVDTIEAILLYHVVPGVTLTARKVARSNGASLTTASGGQIIVRIHRTTVRLVDRDPDAVNPQVVAVDINKGNKQIAHAINRVLRPIDL